MTVSAHPHDEILGAGATLARHTSVGDQVHACALAEEPVGIYASPGRADLLREYAKRAGEVIGFSSLRLDALPGRRLDTLPQVELTHRIEDLVDTIRPEIVYTHFPWDADPDHAVVAKSVWNACQPYRFPFVRCIVAFDSPSSTEWAVPSDQHKFQPNRFVDVNRSFEQKLDAMRCYRSEIKDFPNPRSLRAVRDRASYWGSVAGFEAAEPFMVLRESW
jgi:LmbE family N-acetylglucosaminyl deacetylase